jgi:hypothetical protein
MLLAPFFYTHFFDKNNQKPVIMKGSNPFFRLLIPVLIAVMFSNALSAQCVSGNCQNGTGSYRYAGNIVYTGQFVNGVREGRGKIVLSNGNVYEGQFRQGQMHGEGTMHYPKGDRYVGQWANNKPNGRGTYYWGASKERYEGQFVDGEFAGQGTMFYPDGGTYTGLWKDSRKHGQGKITTPAGKIITGTWNMGKLVSSTNAVATTPGTSPNAPKPTAPVQQPANGKPNLNGLRNCNATFCSDGQGYFKYPDGSIWVGQFRNGYPAGNGTCYYSNGDRYEGEWANNAPNGEGVMFFAATNRVYGAVWLNGESIKELDSREQIPADPIRMEKSRTVKIWAVIVGVSSYTAMPSLKFSDDDAYQVNAFLRSPEGGSLPEEQIQVLIDQNATRQEIINAMRRTFLRADENDVIMLYFSGHGLSGCFLPYDYDGYNNKLRHDEIKQVFMQSKAKHKLCIADACHSGSLNYASKGPAPISLQRYYQVFEEVEGGVALLMSSKAEELSLEDHGLRQGVFTYYLLRGLKGGADTNGDYLITIKELHNFVYSRVREYTANVQTPVLTGDYDDNMPVGLRRY